MILLAFGAKWGTPSRRPSAAPPPPPLNRSGINKEPRAALPRPKLNRDRKCRRLIFILCSAISFAMAMIGLLFPPGYILFAWSASWQPMVPGLFPSGIGILPLPAVLPRYRYRGYITESALHNSH